jgi:hypothetical protein
MRHAVLPRLIFKLIALAALAWACDARAGWQIAHGRLQTPWAAEVSPTNALPDYPRPQLVRADWMNLNGLWDYAITPDTAERPAAYQGAILVPYPVESALSGVMREFAEHRILWYHRTFTVPAGWSGRRLLLRFGAVDWEAKVLLNGSEIGRHRGGYDAFSFDITPAIKAHGVQDLVVEVTDPTEGDQPRGKQSRKPEGIFYNACSGIWQTVWLEPVPVRGINDLKMVPDLDAGVLRLRVVTSDGRDGWQVEATAQAGGMQAGSVTGAPNAELSLPLNPVHRWSPDDPFLYQLRIVLKNQGQAVDEVQSYFGMRSIGLRRDDHGVMRIAFNGDFLFQIGALDQGYWPDGIYTAPTDAALQHDLRFLKSAGFNLVRKHAKVEPDRWYYWCDKLGLLVWQDMPSGNNYTAEGRVRFEAELQRMATQLENHPSIVTWVIFNESWGQFDTERLTHELEELDPSRLVDSASGWTDKRVGDLIDAHSYPFPESPPADASRAIVIGEFGGLGLSLPEHQWSTNFWSYQMLPDGKAQAGWYYHLLQEIWEQKDSRGLSAAVYTQTTDVETECNGLQTYDRRILKIPPGALAAMNSGQIYQEPVHVVLTNAVFGEPVWSYTFEMPSSLWNLPAYDDSHWAAGPGGFGTSFTRGSRVRTTWNSSDIWLRRSFVLGDEDLRNAKFLLHHDKSVEVYLNGVPALATEGYLVDYALFEIAPAALAMLHPGTNCIAVHCTQTAGGQFIDVGIVTLPAASGGASKFP